MGWVLCLFLEELCQSHLPLAESLGFPVCRLLIVCVSCFAWCRSGLPLSGGGIARSHGLRASVLEVLRGCRLSLRGEVGQGGLDFWSLFPLSMLRLFRRM